MNIELLLVVEGVLIGLFVTSVFFLIGKLFKKNIYTIGDGTYTTPNNVAYIRVRAVGAGGGGGGTPSTSGGNVGTTAVNGIVSIGEPAARILQRARGEIVISNDNDKITKIYYNEKGELIVQESYI